MKKYMIVLLTITLYSCSSLGTGHNGSPGENGSNAIGNENGKSGAPGKNGKSHYN
ncbi:hypothetical protein IQ05_00449 [Flavobacterium tiangeerense]|uniref:Collagen triple helix repeat protein n=2 Tax=Flavobacterium tiangeerense TaxID=459471 RepID=A0ABY3FM30_9FLAO|nr:hypothetical protein IQ05_00449 [Flavobacterium tiangeerense]